MGIACHINLSDLPSTVVVQFDNRGEMPLASIIDRKEGTQRLFDRYEDWLCVDCKPGGNNHAYYIPWLEAHGIKYLLS